MSYATVLTAKALRLYSLPVASLASTLLVVFCHFSSDTFFDLIGRGEKESFFLFVFLLNFVAYGLIIKTATGFSFFSE